MTFTTCSRGCSAVATSFRRFSLTSGSSGRTSSMAWHSAVGIRQNKIHRPDDGDEIGQQLAPGHQRHGLDVGKIGSPEAQAVGHVEAVADHVIALLPPDDLRGGVGLPPGDLGAPGGVDEMVDQALDVLQGVLFLGDDIAVVVRLCSAPGGIRLAACSMMRRLWRISSTRTRYRA